MKNKLLPLVFVLASYSAYSQVGIGTTMPNASSQLEVVANDKGVLIPRIQLKNTADASTIVNGNINSLLVFNTATAADIKPGYYYWYDNKWNRIVIAGEVESNKGTVIYNAVTKEFTFVDDSGTNQSLEFESIVKKHETVTILTNNNNGTYTYANEAGDNVTIDVPGDVANNFETIVNNPEVKNILNTFITKSEGNVSYNPVTNEFTFVDASGATQVVNINELVKANETVTILTNNNNGTYTYANEAGDSVTIDVPGDVANNFETIVNNPEVKNILNTFITKTEGNVSYNPVTNEFTYTDASGATQVVNINELVKANETVTILTNNNNGTYTYANEAGDNVTIDVPGDVANNFETIVNNPEVKNILNTFITKTEGNVSYNPVTNEFTYTDASGATQVVNINELVKANETVTILTNNNNGTYTYTNEEGDNVTIDVPGDVANNFETIVNNPEVKNILNTFITKTEGNVSYNPVTNEFTYTDASGTTQVVNIGELVKANETLTSLAYDVTGKTLSYQAEKGAATVINLVDLVGDAETVTILTNNNNGTYTYTNEEGDNVTIDVPGDVANNFETIVNNPEVKNILNTFITKTEGNVSYNPVTNEFTYTDASGTTQVVNIGELVKANETLTSLAYDVTGKTLSYQAEKGAATVINLVDLVGDAETVTILTNNNNGTYTYTNEEGDNVTIDVPGDVANNFETIVNNPEVKNILNTFITKTEGNVSYNPVTNEFTYTDASGTTQVVNIGELVKANETLTSLAYDVTGKTLSYQAEKGAATDIKENNYEKNQVYNWCVFDRINRKCAGRYRKNNSSRLRNCRFQCGR